MIVEALELDLGIHVKAYDSSALNMKEVEAHRYREFNEQEIAAAGSGCWWRTAWLSLLVGKFRGEPEQMREAIIGLLRP